MAFKFAAFAALLAVASAGGPAAYDIAAASGDHASIGFTQESTQKGYAGQNVISSYTKTDDSAHSSVRVSSSQINNDVYLGHEVKALPAIAPTLAASPALLKSYLEPSLLTKSYGNSALLTKSYAEPLYNTPLIKSYAQPALLAKSYEYAAPAPVYAAQAPVYTAQAPVYTAQAPVYAKSALYAAPGPLYAKSALYASAPVLKTAIAAPLVTKAAIAAPVVKLASHVPAYEYAAHAAPIAAAYGAHAPVVHTVFNGLGTSYSW